MRILVTGAAGFLGAEVVRRGVEQGHEVRGLIRAGSPRQRVSLPDAMVFSGDLTDAASLERAVTGVDGVIHCAAVTSQGATDEALSVRVNVEGTRQLLAAAHRAGVRRWVQISSMSAHSGSTSVYGRTKLAADNILRESSPPPNWTILRPSLIYGPGDRGLVAKTVGLLQKLPLVPVLGSGRELIRPVLVSDVADAALKCLQLDVSKSKIYQLGGADEVTLNEFMIRLSQAAGLKRRLIHLPIPVCYAIAKILSMVLMTPPISVDNVKGVREAQPVDHSNASKDWGYNPAGLIEGLKVTFAKSDA